MNRIPSVKDFGITSNFDTGLQTVSVISSLKHLAYLSLFSQDGLTVVRLLNRGNVECWSNAKKVDEIGYQDLIVTIERIGDKIILGISENLDARMLRIGVLFILESGNERYELGTISEINRFTKDIPYLTGSPIKLESLYAILFDKLVRNSEQTYATSIFSSPLSSQTQQEAEGAIEGKITTLNGDWLHCASSGISSLPEAEGLTITGRLTMPTGEAYEGLFNNKGIFWKGTVTYPNGEKFVGKSIGRKREGSYFFLDGSIFTGTFENGELIWGKKVWPNGYFQEGVYEGEEGEYIDQEGLKVRGRLKRGELIEGEMIWSDGHWKKGVFEGRGRCEDSEGFITEGSFEKGELIEGKKMWPNGIWQEGVFQGEGELTLTLGAEKKYVDMCIADWWLSIPRFFRPEGRENMDNGEVIQSIMRLARAVNGLSEEDAYWYESPLEPQLQWVYLGKIVLEGKFLGGRFIKGKKTWPNGYWQEGTFEGKGERTDAFGVTAMGFFENGKLIRGKKTWSSGDWLEGKFPGYGFFGKGKRTGPDGMTLEGTFKNKQLVKGEKTWPDGFWQKGTFEGVGKQEDRDGFSVEGVFEGGQLLLKKRMDWEDDWEGDAFEGKLKLTSRSGVTAEGDFIKGKLVNGKKTWSDGYWQDGTFEGEGRQVHKDGLVLEGIFRNGELFHGRMVPSNGVYIGLDNTFRFNKERAKVERVPAPQRKLIRSGMLVFKEGQPSFRSFHNSNSDVQLQWSPSNSIDTIEFSRMIFLLEQEIQKLREGIGERVDTDSISCSEIFTAPYNGGQVHFEKEEILGDGDCGFTTLGITRDQLVDVLRSLSEREDTREQLFEEIHEALSVGWIPHDGSNLVCNDFRGLNDCYIVWQSRYDKALREARDVYYMPEFSNNLSEEDIYNLSINWLIDNRKSDAQRELELAFSKQKEAIIAIKNFCKTKRAYLAYCNAYTDGLWLGCQSAIVYANATNMSLHIWEKSKVWGHLELKMSTSSTSETSITNHMLFSSGNHFDRLNLTDNLNSKKQAAPNALTSFTSNSSSSSNSRSQVEVRSPLVRFKSTAEERRRTALFQILTAQEAQLIRLKSILDCWAGENTFEQIEVTENNALSILEMVKITEILAKKMGLAGISKGKSTYSIRQAVLRKAPSEINTCQAYTYSLSPYDHENTDYLFDRSNWIDERIAMHTRLIIDYTYLSRSLANRMPRVVVATRGNTGVGKSFYIQPFLKAYMRSKLLGEYLDANDHLFHGVLNPDHVKAILKEIDSLPLLLNSQVLSEGRMVFKRFLQDLTKDITEVTGAVIDTRLLTIADLGDILAFSQTRGVTLEIIDVDASIWCSILTVLNRSPYGKDPCVTFDIIREGFINARANRGEFIRAAISSVGVNYSLYCLEPNGDYVQLARKEDGDTYLKKFNEDTFEKCLQIPSEKKIDDIAHTVITDEWIQKLQVPANRKKEVLSLWTGCTVREALEKHSKGEGHDKSFSRASSSSISPLSS